MEKDIHLPNNIKHLRKSSGHTLEKLGALIGKSGETIGGYEKGRSSPSFEGLLLLGEVFDINIHDLVYRDLEREGIAARPTEDTGLEETHQKLYVELLMKRIKEMEREIKEKSPDLAKRLNID